MRLVGSTILGKIGWIRHGMLAPGWSDGCPNPDDNLSFTTDSAPEVRKARGQAAELLGTTPDHFTHVYQIHGSTVIHVTSADRGKGSSPTIPHIGQGDALITRDPWVPIAVLVADCLPVLLVDTRHRAVGLAHAGWRGVLARVPVLTLDAMRYHFGTNPRDVSAWIAPGIGRCCFEVGPSVIDQFSSNFPKWGDCWSVSPMRIDLKQLVGRMLESAGVPGEHIDISSDCTVCHPGYFSYRRDGSRTGHNMAVLMIVDDSMLTC